MGLPQVIYLCILFAGWGIVLVNHGKLRRTHAGYSTLDVALTIALLWWGGFFS